MESLIETVGILQITGDDELQFIKILESELVNYCGNGYVLEYNDLRNKQQKETIIYMNLRKFKERQLPLIVLISKSFLDELWSTAYKGIILKDITNYVSPYCLHIWLGGLTETEIIKYSVTLCRIDGAFRRIALKDIKQNTLVESIRSFLSDVKKKPCYENFALDKQQERLQSFDLNLNNSPSMSMDNTYDEPFSSYASSSSKQVLSKSNTKISDEITSKSSVTNPVSKPNPKKKKQDSHYKDVASMMLLDDDLDDVKRDNIPPPSAFSSLESASGSTTNKKKKKKKKVGVAKMANLSYGHIHRIASMLDVGYGANWKQIAAYYGIDNLTVSNIELALVRNESPTENLLHLLRVRIPDLTISDFVDKCTKVLRNDVVLYIQENVLP